MDRVLLGPAVPAAIVERTGETLVDLLHRAVERDPGAVALVTRGRARTERWTYAELRDRAARIAQTLAELGVQRGTRVAAWAPNDPWLVAAYLATWSHGAAIVPLDLRMQEDVAIRIGARTAPAVLLAGRELPEASAAALGARVLRVTPDALDPGSGTRTAGPALPSPDPADVAEILFTSGTTSDPKGVVLTHGQILHSVRAIALAAGLERQRALALIPLSHMYGQMVPLLYGLMTNSRITFPSALTPSTVAAAMRAERTTALTVVPQVLQVLLDGIESEAIRSGALGRLRSAQRLGPRLPFPLRRLLFRSVLQALGGELRVVSCGGAYLPPALQLAWEAMGVRVIQGYGATECAAIAGHTRDSRRPGTAGPPLAGMEITIAPDGELLARGPNVMVGYWDDPAATAAALVDGWAHTGDAATIDEAGEIVILGRTRDRIALPNGLKVYPEDVEIALRAEDAIRDAVVFEAAPGRLAAVVVPAGEADDATINAALRVANATLAPHQRVRTWVRWPETDLPRTHTLKVRRGQVIDRARALLGDGGGEEHAAGSATATDAPAPATGIASAAPPRDPGPAPPGHSASGRPTSGRDSPDRPTSGLDSPDRATSGRDSPDRPTSGRDSPDRPTSGLDSPDRPTSGRDSPDRPASGQPARTGEDLLARLVRVVAEVVAGSTGKPPSGLIGATRIDSLDLDSLALVVLSIRIEETMGASLEDDEIASARDLAALAGLVADRQGAAPPPEPSRWAFSPPARLVRRALDATLAGALVRLVGRPTATGVENLGNLPGPVIICPNHTSHLDAPSVRQALPSGLRARTAIAAAADYFFSGGPLGPIVALATGAFPFGRTSHVRASLERVRSFLDDGWSVILFPEGTRSPDGRLGPLHEGIGLLATTLDVPVVPVHITGAHAILPKGRALPRRRRGARVRIRFGVPLRFDPGTSVHEATARLRAAMVVLGDEQAGQGGGR